MSKGEGQKWYDLSEALITGLEDHISKGDISKDELIEFVRSACRAILRQEGFANSHQGKEHAILLDLLYNMLQSGLRYEGTLAMVPLQMSLFAGGQLTLKEFVDYIRDAALLANGYELNNPAEDEADEELQNLEDEFNHKLDIIEELAERDEYAEAIKILDEAFAMAEKEPLLFYDRCTMYNNRAYYNFRLGNFEEALKDCEIAIADHEQGLFYHTKAEILLGMKKYREALVAIEKAIELEPGQDKADFKREIERALK